MEVILIRGIEESGRPRHPHKLETVGSNPTPATNITFAHYKGNPYRPVCLRICKLRIAKGLRTLLVSSVAPDRSYNMRTVHGGESQREISRRVVVLPKLNYLRVRCGAVGHQD